MVESRSGTGIGERPGESAHEFPVATATVYGRRFSALPRRNGLMGAFLAEFSEGEKRNDDLPVLPGDEQLALFYDAGAELLSVDEDERRGRFSGEIIERNREKVRLIWRALELGIGVNKIAKAMEVSVHTVIELQRRHPRLAALADRRLVGTLQAVCDLGWERYLEALVANAIPAAQLPVGLGIAADKKALLEGKPTAIVMEKRGISVESLNAWVDSLPKVKGCDV